MKKQIFLSKMPLLLLISGLVVTASVAQTVPEKEKNSVPSKQKKIRNLDEALFEVDLNEAEMAKVLKEIDFQKIHKDIQASLKEIDMQKISADIDAALKEIDINKIRIEVAAALKDVNMDKIKAEVAKIKQVDMANIQKQLQKIQPQIERSMKEAHKGLEKAKIELRQWKTFVDDLEKDGLIKKDHYSIQYKSGELLINGKKQAEEVLKKYSDFLKGKKDFKLEKTDDNFNIEQ